MGPELNVNRTNLVYVVISTSLLCAAAPARPLDASNDPAPSCLRRLRPLLQLTDDFGEGHLLLLPTLHVFEGHLSGG
jgi:hypothetical protein